MPNLTLKNLPDDLHRRLKERAARHRRSLNSEILATLETAIRSEPIDPRAFLERIRAHRPPGHERLTADDLDTWKREGRP